MIEPGRASSSALCAVAMPSAEEGSSSLLRLLIFVAIFIGPAILKSIKESQKKKRESAERGARASPALADTDSDSSAPALPEYESSTLDEGDGRQQWERLMRGEAASAAPAAPPPLPPSRTPQAPIPQVPRRRVLTETRPLTEEEALTESAPLTGARPPEKATPGMSYETTPSYDEQSTQQNRLGREFAEFAPQEGLASDREGGPTRRVGASPSFAGGEKFQDLGSASMSSEVTQKQLGGDTQAESASRLRRLRRARFDRAELRRCVIAAEVLGPPLALRAFETGPSRPLGWN